MLEANVLENELISNPPTTAPQRGLFNNRVLIPRIAAKWEMDGWPLIIVAAGRDLCCPTCPGQEQLAAVSEVFEETYRMT